MPGADAVTVVDPSACVKLSAGRDVGLASEPGVEIRAAGAAATVDEVEVSYLPQDRPNDARHAGASGRKLRGHAVCGTMFSLSPSRAGSFAPAGRAGGGRPRLTLRAERPAGGASRVLATSEGEAALSITATLEPVAQAVLDYREPAVAALVMEIL